MRFDRIVCLLLFSVPAAAQVCRVSAAGLTQNRRAMGAIHAECPVSVHSPPFGNWGVTSNFGQKGNSRQFDGWCHESFVCDNSGNCWLGCTDGWYEWNSCTDIAQYRAPNCSLYNAAGCTEQVSTTGINVHGTKTVDVPVSCPLDADGDGAAEAGGCADLSVFTNGTNFLSLYELDPGTSDTLIQTVYFPETAVPLTCDAWGCEPAASFWVAPTSYDSPSWPPKVYAEMAMVVNGATFVNTGSACAIAGNRTHVVSSASFAAPPIATDSLATIFGAGLATATEAAGGPPLPTTLAGSTVTLRDSAGVSQQASLLYASPSQINFLVPQYAAAGPASVVVRRSDGVVWRAAAEIAAVIPGLFSANGDGMGVAAAYAVRVTPDGAQQYISIYQCGAGAGSCVAVPIDLGSPDDLVFLVLFGTGIRNHGDLSTVSLLMGTEFAPVYYAGDQMQYPGLDQVNALIPRSLQGAGELELLLIAGDRASNVVTIQVR